MCMVEMCNPCEVWKETTPKARKLHRCRECDSVIHPGEKYLRIFTVFEGDADTFKLCSECQKACDWLRNQCGGFVIGAIFDDLFNHRYEEKIRDADLRKLIIAAKMRMRVAEVFKWGLR